MHDEAARRAGAARARPRRLGARRAGMALAAASLLRLAVPDRLGGGDALCVQRRAGLGRRGGRFPAGGHRACWRRRRRCAAVSTSASTCWSTGCRRAARAGRQAWAALATGVVAGVLIINGWETAQLARMLGLLTEGNLEWPTWLLMLLMPVGGALLLLAAIEALWRALAGAAAARRHGDTVQAGQRHDHRAALPRPVAAAVHRLADLRRAGPVRRRAAATSRRANSARSPRSSSARSTATCWWRFRCSPSWPTS